MASWRYTGRVMTRAGYTDWIWVPYLRRCWVGPDKVEVTHPIIFGRGFLFDGLRRVVTIRRCLLGRTLSEEEIPFSELTIQRSRHLLNPTQPALSDVGHRIDLYARGEQFHIELDYFSGGKRATRVETAIRTLLRRSRK